MVTNVILFGDAGVGKSSVINLIAGKDVSKISPDGWRCPLESKHHQFELLGGTCNIWETIGLGGCSFSTVADCLGAIGKTYALIQQIEAQGGLHLLLLCIPESISLIPSMACNYKLFFNVLCNAQVPIALVVTHLERGARVVVWWDQNEDRICGQWGLKFYKHVCVTSPVHLHLLEHREALVDLLLEYEECHPIPAFDWLSGFLERLHTIHYPEELKKNPRELERFLRNHCMMAAADARRLLEKLGHSIGELSPLPEGDRSEHGENSSFNIILFGEPSVGKSSVINFIADEDVAEMSSDGWGCTLESKHHMIEVRSRTFNIWETVGLGGCSFSTAADCLGAIEKTYALIQQIKNKGGLDLLLFCIPEGILRISTMICNYRLFFDGLCKGKIPITLVVTHLESEAKVDGWWDQNKDRIYHSGLQFDKHACVTPSEHLDSANHRGALVDILLEFNHERRHPMPPASAWFSDFLERLPVIPCREQLTNNSRELEQLLRDRYKVNAADARRLAERLHCTVSESPFPVCGLPKSQKSSFNIVLFGEMGVGKSSVINLMANEEVAETSSDATGVTLQFEQYPFEVAGRTFNIWDTAGLEEPSDNTPVPHFPAIEQAYKLIKQIEAKGGLDLLLLCIRGSRITTTTQSNYRLFFEVLCESRIPISVVVTHLEREKSLMEDWWLRNKKHIHKLGLEFSGHACVTALRDVEPRRARESRSAMELLLLKFDDKGRYPMPPTSDWFAGFLKRLSKSPILKLLKFKPNQKELEQLLRDRCNMETNKAKQLAGDLIRIRSQDHSA